MYLAAVSLSSPDIPICVCMYTYLYVCIRMYTCVYVCMRMYIQYTPMYIWALRLCMHTYAYVCIRMYVLVPLFPK